MFSRQSVFNVLVCQMKSPSPIMMIDEKIMQNFSFVSTPTQAQVELYALELCESFDFTQYIAVSFSLLSGTYSSEQSNNCEYIGKDRKSLRSYRL